MSHLLKDWPDVAVFSNNEHSSSILQKYREEPLKGELSLL